ncbi:MAG: ribonuclease P protein component [Chitinophagaceae bacterium]|nr:MAG: ribonuclease P protein component [Chitinophagaceae bacterium]
MIKATLNKTERLKSRKIIDALFKEGRGVSSFPIRITYRILPATDHTLQAGFTASSRTFKRAVHRNRIKRLLREAYRHQKADLLTVLESSGIKLAIFIIFTGKELPDYAIVEEKMKSALRKLKEQLINPGKAKA